MKNNRTQLFHPLLTLACILFCCISIVGCGDNSSGGSSRSELESTISKLRAENQKLKQERDEAQSVARSRYVTLSVIAYGALGIAILLIGGFIFMVRSSKHTPQTTTTDSLHCPRCGWEHGPNETVCKNCKTHF